MHKIHKLVMVPFIPYEVVQNVIFYCSVNGTYGYNYDKRYSPDFLKEKHGIPNHMYLVSDDHIKDFDIVLCMVTMQVLKWDSQKEQTAFPASCKKVIATTNKIFGLPIIDPGFIQGILSDLSNDKSIISVKVGYKPLSDSEIVKLINWDNWRGENGEELQKKEVKRSEILKQNGIIWVSKDNFITIAKLKQTFTRDEVMELIEDFVAHTHHISLNKHPERGEAIKDWINNKF